VQHPRARVDGEFVERDGAQYYCIRHYDRMRPFLMSVVSDSDHWMFLSSNGALTAGRCDPDSALFPYYTDDKIHNAADTTGSKTLCLVAFAGQTCLWEPFSDRYAGLYSVRRNLYKGVYGNEVIFEEINEDLSLTFHYAWSFSERFGFVKAAGLRNFGHEPVSVRILDGIQNVLPYGVNEALQVRRSTLLDAYKKNELEVETGLSLFLLSSIVVDKPEPSEALKATTVWSAGLDASAYLISSRQLARFRRGEPIETESDIRAKRGAYFVHASLTLSPAKGQDWYVVADVNQGPAQVVEISEALRDRRAIIPRIRDDIDAGSKLLRRLVAAADGMQCTEDALTSVRHYSNVLYNVMRGGIFDHHDRVYREDLRAFVAHHNRPVADAHRDTFASLPEATTVSCILDVAAQSGDPRLERLCHEYLPLKFSRRHGDPSRPWNQFSIRLRDEGGRRLFHYQGNWRDIFQNWEALCISFPFFIENMISKFVNASTADGYNPYRISQDGIDWEVIDPDDPWSFIGYWGDHQIIYLLKLLEISHAHYPGRLRQRLTHRMFAYANVPYRIKPYTELLRNPHDTIRYDNDLADLIAERVEEIGADGKLVFDRDGALYQVNLTEKLLVTVLAKLSNFIPEAGIWMNTQRPEWNDANNALVGFGVSVVTLCYLRRFLHFAARLFEEVDDVSIPLSEEVAVLFEAVDNALMDHGAMASRPLSTHDRRSLLDALGEAGSQYRETVYRDGFSGRLKRVRGNEVRAFFERALPFLDQAIRANRRADGLYHAYNLMSLEADGGIAVRRLYEMLEGQVAVLSSGLLSGKESLDVLDALKAGALFRSDQNSYLLYPDRKLTRFMQKNVIPEDRVVSSPLLRRLAEADDRHIIERDVHGTFHFNGAFRNGADVRAALARLKADGYPVDRDGEAVVALFHSLFDHDSYTGRSGTFFGYEGLGCVYWHMVSKLLLAVGETYFRAADEGAPASVLGRLVEHYYSIRSGIGLNKRPEEFGAFPTDPYSHTPGNAGAQQPGMTGQVKEDILSRWNELGIVIEKGCVSFRPHLLRASEFLTHRDDFQFFDVSGEEQSLPLSPGSLGFTYCQIPIIYRMHERAGVRIQYADGETKTIDGLALNLPDSERLFSHAGTIRRIEVSLMPAL